SPKRPAIVLRPSIHLPPSEKSPDSAAAEWGRQSRTDAQRSHGATLFLVAPPVFRTAPCQQNVAFLATKLHQHFVSRTSGRLVRTRRVEPKTFAHRPKFIRFPRSFRRKRQHARQRMSLARVFSGFRLTPGRRVPPLVRSRHGADGAATFAGAGWAGALSFF